VADRVVLHIGTMKSGTTYLQSVLGSGVLEPEGGWYVGGSFDVQDAAVGDVLGPGAWPAPRWDRLVEEMHGRSGVAVVSHEFLSFMGDDRAQDVVGSLPSADVTVVLTVRDQRQAIPAQWQSFARNRGLDDWGTYQSRLGHPERRGGPRARRAVRSFRRAQNVSGMLRRWTRLQGVGVVVVVVVPPPAAGPRLLWHRFCEAAGLTPGEPPEARQRSNESLGRASCEVLVALNGLLQSWSREDFRPLRDAVVDALLPLRDLEDPPVLDRTGAAVASQLNTALVDAVRTHGVRVVGDLGELVLDRGEEPTAVTSPPDPGQLLRAGLAAWQVLLPDVAPPEVGTAHQVLADLSARLTGSVTPHEG
jgi:hypothetical protein